MGFIMRVFGVPLVVALTFVALAQRPAAVDPVYQASFDKWKADLVED